MTTNRWSSFGYVFLVALHCVTTRKAGRRVLVKAFALTRCSKSKRAVPQISLKISWLRSKILTLMEISEVNMKQFMVGK